jgi:hypothetical protein
MFIGLYIYEEGGKVGTLFVCLFWLYDYHFHYSLFMADKIFVASSRLKDYVVVGNWQSFD